MLYTQLIDVTYTVIDCNVALLDDGHRANEVPQNYLDKTDEAKYQRNIRAARYEPCALFLGCTLLHFVYGSINPDSHG